MINTSPSIPEDSVRFPSLSSLRAAHSDLLKRFRSSGLTPESIIEVETFLRLGKATGALLDNDADRWSVQSQLDYWATQLYRPDHEPPDATLDEFDPQLAPEIADALCPYVGLDSFHESKQSVFFGRGRLIAELSNQIKTSRFLAVLGSSGSGKSSLVRAGLIPFLKKGGLPGSENWAILPPIVPGSNPLANLARLFLPADPDPDLIESTINCFREEFDYLVRLVSDRFNENIVLVIDQFEEIFTLCTDDVERTAFVDNLISLCREPDSQHRVIITMRSDFETNVTRIPDLQAIFEKNVVRITSFNASELREIIEAPAALIGLKFEEGVVDALLKDILGEPAALPLLQFTLLKLWENRERNRVTWNTYQKLGGGRQALARSADEFYNGLIHEEQVTMKRILLKMVRPGEGLEVTSNRIQRAALYQKAEASDRIERVLDKLIKERLVRISEGDSASDEQVEIAHEALIRNWPRLVDWLEEDRIALRQRQRLTTAAEEWQRLNRVSSALWRRELLEEARRYDDLNDLEKQFVHASTVRQERARLFWVMGIFVTIAWLVSTALLYRNQRNIAMDNLAEAQAQAKLALASRLASQAQLIIETGSSRQTTAILLAVRSMQLSTSVEAAQILQNTVLAAPIASLPHDEGVGSIAFSPNGMYMVSGSYDDGTVRLWETATWQEVASLKFGEWVNAVAFTPDGQDFVAAGCDQVDETGNCIQGTERIGDVARGKELASVAFTGDPYSVTFSPDGRFALSTECGQFDEADVCTETLAYIWQTKTGKEVARTTHDGDISDVAFSPDGKYIVAGRADGVVEVWDVSAEREIARMSHNNNWVNSVRISPDSQYVVSGSDDATARVWEISTGREVAAITHEDWVTTVVFSPDGQYIVSAGCDLYDNDYNCTKSTARAWEIGTEKELARLTHDGEIRSIIFSQDGQYAATTGCESYDIDYVCTQGTTRVWETARWAEVAHITQNSGLSPVMFSPDGRYLVSGSEEGPAHVWNTVTGQGNIPLTHGRNITSVELSADGELIVSSGDGTVKVWEAATGNEIAHFTYGGWVSSAAISPDGQLVVAGGCDQYDEENNCEESLVPVWEVATGKEIAGITQKGEVSSVSFSANGKYIISTGCDQTDEENNCTQGMVRVWELATGKEIAHMTHNSYVYPVSFSPNGQHVISAGCDRLDKDDSCVEGTARVWEATTGKEVAHMTHDGYVSSAAFSIDGKYVVSGDEEGIVRIWEAATGEEVARMAQNSYINAVAFSPDGKYVVTGSDDGTARVWESSTGMEIARMRYDSYVGSVAFSPDGKYVVSGGGDTTVRVWEAGTGNEIARISHADSVISTEFSPDGKNVVSGSYDGTLQVWSWKPLDSIQSACSRLSRNLTSSEWEQYMGAVPYQVICPNLPIHATVISDLILSTLLDADDKNRVQTAIELATDLLEKNSPNADSGDQAEALVKATIQDEIFRAYNGFDLQDGNIEPSLILLEDAELIGLEIDDPSPLNDICWFGSIYGYAKDVLPYCEQAVDLAGDDAAIRDSRGLARALTGDHAGAIDDFQFLVDSGQYAGTTISKQRQRWIIDLKAGKDPFTPDELDSLKSQ